MGFKRTNAVALAIGLGVLGASIEAEAQDFGLGAGATLASPLAGVGGFGLPLPGPLVGLEATYWLDDSLALDFYGSLGVVVPDGGDARFDLGLGGGILYALFQGDDSKLELGVRGGVIAVINQMFGVGDDEDADLFLDVLLRFEHWFDNHFAINGQVGIGFRGDPDGNPGFGMALGAQAGLGMMYYIDGNARPGDGSSPEPIVSSGSGSSGAYRGGGGGGNGGGGGGAATSGTTGGGTTETAEEPLPDPESGAAGW